MATVHCVHFDQKMDLCACAHTHIYQTSFVVFPEYDSNTCLLFKNILKYLLNISCFDFFFLSLLQSNNYFRWFSGPTQYTYTPMHTYFSNLCVSVRALLILEVDHHRQCDLGMRVTFVLKFKLAPPCCLEGQIYDLSGMRTWFLDSISFSSASLSFPMKMLRFFFFNFIFFP